jgi:hypothetical protein
MANTTNFNWETPDDTDLVKDGALAIRTLGSAIDTSFVDLKGGTTGQVLSKNSNTDLDFAWIAQDDSNAIQNNIVDAKGDLITATANDTPARLAVGTDGQALIADSTAPTGLKWGAVSSLIAPIPKGFSVYAMPEYQRSGSSGAAATEDVTYYSAIYLPSCTLDRILVTTSSAFSGTATVRLGIYNLNSNNVPGTVLLDAGTVSATAASTNYEITISQAIDAGWYYLAGNSQTNATTNSFMFYNPVEAFNSTGNWFTTAPGTGTQTKRAGFQQTGVTGAFATAASLTASNSVMRVAVRIS